MKFVERKKYSQYSLGNFKGRWNVNNFQELEKNKGCQVENLYTYFIYGYNKTCLLMRERNTSC